MRAPRKGGKKDQSPGAILVECRMGAGREAKPMQADTPGWETRQLPGILPDPRGREKLALERHVRRMTQHSVVHTIAWESNGDVSARPSRPGPKTPIRRRSLGCANTFFDTDAKE